MSAPGASAHACSTSGKLPLLTPDEGGPDLWVRGAGPTFWDASGRRWLDFDMCLGSVIWGHGRQEITTAAFDALSGGGAPTVPSVMEAKAASILLRRLERYEAVCFFKTGAEACTAAVRLARRARARALSVSDGFHGWHDWNIADAYPAERDDLGVPTAVQALNLRLDPAEGLDAALLKLKQAGDRVAVAVFRPEAWEAAALGVLVAAARAQGAWVVCDEMTSHFKYGRYGSAFAKGVEPDLICLGKGLANGLPLAALAGPRQLIRAAAVAKISSTHSSETWSLAAMVAAEGLLEDVSAWPSWRPDLDVVANTVRAALLQLDLTEFQVVQHPGFFSIERPAAPFRQDPFRKFLVARLGAEGLYTRGWFHGSDAHAPADWARLSEALITALQTWANTQGVLAHQKDVLRA